MSDIDLTALPGEEIELKKRHDAFASEFAWHGKELHGLSSSRKDYWTSICKELGFPGLSEAVEDVGLFTPAAKALLFVLATDRKHLCRLRADTFTERIEAEMTWTDANVSISEEGDAVALAIQILNASIVNSAQPIPTAGPESKN